MKSELLNKFVRQNPHIERMFKAALVNEVTNPINDSKSFIESLGDIEYSYYGLTGEAFDRYNEELDVRGLFD